MANRSGAVAFGDKISLVEAAVAEADSGKVTNQRKLEALTAVESVLLTLPRAEILEQQTRLENLCERLLGQSATQPLRRLVVSILSGLHTKGNSSSLYGLVERLLKIAGDQGKKIHNNTKVASLSAVGELMVLHGRALEGHSTDVFVVIAKHMKFTESTAKVSAFQCLCGTVSEVGFRNASIAGNIWKMLQKMVPDKSLSVRTAAAQALSVVVKASRECAFANGDSMADMCKKCLAAADEQGTSYAATSESRFYFSLALADVLSAMASPEGIASAASAKKKPLVSDFASCLGYLEQAAAKGPASGAAVVSFRASLCLTAVRLMKIYALSDSASIGLLMRSLLAYLDLPVPPKRSSSSSAADEDPLPLVARHVSAALRHVLSFIDSESLLLETIENVLVPLAAAQFNDSSPNTDARMSAALETLCNACTLAGESFRSVEDKVCKPLLHLVGNFSNPLVQLQAAYCLRSVAHSSPSQLFQLMSVLLNLATVQNAELLGTPGPRRSGTATSAATGNNMSAELQPLLRGLFGHCAALAALVGELFHSDLGVPHDVTSAVLGTARALLQPHPNATITAQRRSCAFILVEALMCLGTDWVGHRLTVLFALWKAALGKKPVERAKALYQHYLSSGPAPEGGAGLDGGMSGCRDELLSLLCALRSLHAFTLHSNDTLLTSLPHLHKILVVFLTNVSQLLTALPHPTSASLRAKTPAVPGQGWPSIAFAAKCGIPEILLMIRSTMYHTFASMLTTQYSSRFVPLLNMLAHDITMPSAADFPSIEFLANYLPPEDTVLDLVDPYLDSSRDSIGTTRLATAAFLATSPVDPDNWTADVGCDLFSDASASSFFCGPPHEGRNSVEVLLMPWDAWLDPFRTLSSQCTSPEWDWRQSALSLLAIIMNSSEVSEAPRGQVLMHLLKRRESADDKRNNSSMLGDQSIIPSLAVLLFLREHLKASAHGSKGAPPQVATEHILRMSFDGLKEPNPAIRRLHVEILSVLFYIHYEFTDSSVGASIIQHIGTETVSDSATVQSQSAIALLCGSLLRTFAAGVEQATTGTKKQRSIVLRPVASNGSLRPCPYLPNVVPLLLKLAKETSQPVRLWMLHAMNISMQAVGGSFCPFLKDALRLAIAHLLADLFASPIVLWVISALVQSASSVVLSASSTGDESLREENVTRIFSIWSELQHTRYLEPSESLAFAIVRTEVLSISTANSMVQLAPIALDQLKDVFDLIVKKLAPKSGSELTYSQSCAVRVAAAQCITDLVANGHSLGDSAMEPLNFFMLLDCSRGAESQAIHQLIRALIQQGGLSQLPLWIQTLKELILASAKASTSTKEVPQKPSGGGGGGEGDDDWRPGEGHDDSEAMAQTGGDSASRVLRSTTKVFAVSCAHLLLEQADPQDARHFQAENVPSSQSAPSSPSNNLPSQHRLVHHLETFIALASNASSSDDFPLAEAGLKLMLLVVQRFRHTRDLAGNSDEIAEECPLLLVQYEAQVTTCVRHNLLPQADPRAVSLALELLHQIIVERACRSPQRLITLLMQPFVSQTFEADPSFCESTSTRRFLYRLKCACAILDTNMEEEATQAVQNHTKDLARWIEHALRDTAVLIAGLPLQNIKTYQPTCFSLTDYKAVRPCFLEVLPALLRGICALCGSKSGLQLPGEMVSLALGIIFMQFSDRSAKPSVSDIKIYLRTMKKVLLQGTIVGSEMTGTYVLDLLGAMWQFVFCVPQRCQPLLVDVLDVLHMVTAVIRQRQKSKNQSDAASKAIWLDEIFQVGLDGSRGLAVVSSYALHCISAALRDKELVSDAGLVQQALDVFVWWFESSLLEGLDLVQTPAENGEESTSTPVSTLGSNGKANYWLWFMFLSPFPIELASTHPAVTLKYWRTVCSLMTSPSINEDERLLLLPPVINMLCNASLAIVADSGKELTETQERQMVYLFALLAPALVSLCTLLGQGVFEHASKAIGDHTLQTEVEECREERNETSQDCDDEDEATVLKPLTDDFDMQKLNGVKLIAVDLDKTLYPDGMGNRNVDPEAEAKEEFDKNIHGFLDFMKNGGLAIPVTGNSPALAQQKFDRSEVAWNVEEHAGIFCNGALVLGVGGIVEYSAAIPTMVIKQIQDWVAAGDGFFEFEGSKYPFAVNCLTKSKVLYFLPKETNPESHQIADDWASMQLMKCDVADAELEWDKCPAYQLNLLLKSKDELLKECPEPENDIHSKIKEIQTALLNSLEEEIGPLDVAGCHAKHVVEPWCETNIVILGVSKGQSLNRFIHSKSVKENIGELNVGVDVMVAGDAANDVPMFREWPRVDDFHGEVLQETERPPVRVIMPDAHDETLSKEANLKNKVHEVVDAISKARAKLTQVDHTSVATPDVIDDVSVNTPQTVVTKAALDVGGCLNSIKHVFSAALQHSNAKSVQAAVSSVQNLLQNPACVVLSPVIVPCLISALTNPVSTMPEASFEIAYGAVPAMVASLQASDAELHKEFNGAATQMMLMIVVCKLRNESLTNNPRCHKPAIAQCILQLTRADPAGMKAQVARLPAEAQQSIQQLLRDHMSAATSGTTAAQGATSSVATEPAKKIELKMKF